MARCFAGQTACPTILALGNRIRPCGTWREALRALFDHYAENPPPAVVPDATPEQRVVDWLAGMTDRFAIREFTQLALPQGF